MSIVPLVRQVTRGTGGAVSGVVVHLPRGSGRA
ncbi:serine/threonine protein kinase, partial [Streptomyces sp. WAC04770]